MLLEQQTVKGTDEWQLISSKLLRQFIFTKRGCNINGNWCTQNTEYNSVS